jgi:uncharacterized protein (TIGR02231 family)
MKTLAAGLLLATTIFTPAYGIDISSTSSIDAVTVFPQGAQVTRIAMFSMPAGKNTIILKDLPADVVIGSLRVEGEAKGQMAIGSVDSRKVFILNAATSDAERKRIEDQIQVLFDKRKGLEDALSAAAFRKEVVQGIAKRSLKVPQISKDQTAAAEPDWNALLELVSVQLHEINIEIRTLEVEQRDVDKQMVELEKKLASEAPAREKRTEVAVHVSADSAQTGKLFVHYQVAQARWTPAYDARLETVADEKKPSLKLVHRADVTQNTGELWNNISLKLSTSRPRGTTAAPDLNTLQVIVIERLEHLQTNQPTTVYKRKVLDSLKSESEENLAGNIQQEADDAEPMEQKVASFVPSGFQAIYGIGGKVSIGNTGQVKKVQIRETAHKPKLNVRAAPVLDPTAYLYANFTSSKDAALLAGPVALYRDGVFIGNGSLPHLAPDAEHKLGFGPDDAVQIKRVEVDRKSGETGILTSSNQDRRSFKITIENHHQRSVPVTILDRMPYAVNDDIKMEVISGGSKPTRKNDEDKRGVMVWEMNMKPGQKSELHFGYTITWPTDMNINLAAR